jgi:hypothetical protein
MRRARTAQVCSRYEVASPREPITLSLDRRTAGSLTVTAPVRRVFHLVFAVRRQRFSETLRPRCPTA